VSGHRAKRRAFETKRNKVTGEWSNTNDEELHNLHLSTSGIRMIKPRTKR
jgi:hypothetical protein